MDRKRYITVLAVLLILNFLPVSEAKDENPAVSYVAHVVDEAISSLTAKGISLRTKEKRFKKLLIKTFDVDFLSRFTMGRYWRQATDAQKAKYTELFTSLLSQNYATLFNNYSGEQVKIISSNVDEQNDHTIVRGELIQVDGKVVSLHWRLKGETGRYKMLDVIVEGISMLTTQREEMMSVIQNHNYDIDKLLTFLETKVGK